MKWPRTPDFGGPVGACLLSGRRYLLLIMPFTRQTTRRPGRHLITLGELDLANQQITREMETLGFWHPRLENVTVWLVSASFSCYGWFHDEDDIYIPAVTGAQLSDLIFGYHTRLTDVLRHEWAHALADRRPSLVRMGRFRETFGGPYHSSEAVTDYDPTQHLTPYAATNPCEDFAETFHFYLRHKGRLPLRLQAKSEIVRKWDFVASAARY